MRRRRDERRKRGKEGGDKGEGGGMESAKEWRVQRNGIPI